MRVPATAYVVLFSCTVGSAALPLCTLLAVRASVTEDTYRMVVGGAADVIAVHRDDRMLVHVGQALYAAPFPGDGRFRYALPGLTLYVGVGTFTRVAWGITDVAGPYERYNPHEPRAISRLDAVARSSELSTIERDAVAALRALPEMNARMRAALATFRGDEHIDEAPFSFDATSPRRSMPASKVVAPSCARTRPRCAAHSARMRTRSGDPSLLLRPPWLAPPRARRPSCSRATRAERILRVPGLFAIGPTTAASRSDRAV